MTEALVPSDKNPEMQTQKPEEEDSFFKQTLSCPLEVTECKCHLSGHFYEKAFLIDSEAGLIL